MLFRVGVAFLHLAQPVVRTWGRLREQVPTRRQKPPPPYSPMAGPVTHVGGGTLLLPESRSRADLVASIVGNMRRARIPVAVPSGWETYDADLFVSLLVRGELVTSAHPPGCVQVRVRRRPRLARVAAAALVVGAAAWLNVWLGVVVVVACGADAVRGCRRSGPLVRLVVEEATR